MTLVDAHARARIATSHAETLFVEAGAGSGKTASLVSRLVNVLIATDPAAEGAVQVDEVAAITFTEAAASELRTRVRQALEDVAAGRPVLGVDGGPVAAARALFALGKLDQATITTLHAFAQRLLLSSPVDAGLPPRLEVHDEITSRLRFADRWARFERQLLDEPSLASVWDIAMEAGVHSGQLQTIAAMFTQNWDLVEAVPDFVADCRARTVDLDDVPVDGWVRCLDDLVAAVADVDATCKLRAWVEKNLGRKAAELRSLRDRPIAALACVPTATDWPKPGGLGNKRHWDPAEKAAFIARVKATCADISASRDGVFDDALTRIGAELADYTVRDAEARAREGVLEFHDLLVLARRLLRSDPAVRARIHGRYRRLLIDEFQDTDPLQIELAMRIAGPPDQDVSQDWEGVAVEDGRLFFVGDPKQSIYRFRRADIDLFLRTAERFRGGATTLSTNFRTVEPIVQVVNAVFEALIRPSQDDIGRTAQPSYTPLSPHRPAMADAGPPVVLVGSAAAHSTAGAARAAEAVDIAAVIAQAKREAWKVEVDGETRTCEWADITILLPSRTTLGVLRTELEHQGIPYRIESGTLVYGTTEVNDLLAILRAVDDPGDGVAIAGALRSPAYGCGDDDLARWVRAHGSLAYVGASVSDLLDDERILADDPVAAGLADLRRRHRSAPFQSVPTIVGDVVRDRSLHALALDGDGHRDSWRLLRVVLEDARAFADAEPGGLRSFLQWAALRRDDKIRATSPVIPEADVDAVRIMTVHASKGLEFSITVVSGLSGRDPNRASGPVVQFRPEGGFDVRLRKGMETTRFESVRTLEETMDEHERIRLLYVALTRARDHLVVSTHHFGRGGSHGRRLTDCLAELDHTLPIERFTVDAVGAADPGPEDDPAPEIVPALVPATADDIERWDRDSAAWEATRSRLLAVSDHGTTISATALARMLRDEAVADGADGDDADADADPALAEHPPWRRGRAGTNIGRAVHAVLQHVDLGDQDGVAITDLARWQATLEGVPEQADVIERKVRAALRSDLVRRAVAAPRSWRELHVAVPVSGLVHGGRFGDGSVGGSGDDGLVFEGFVDLLFEEEGGLVVVDYKTDAASSPAQVAAALDGHAPQGAAYAVAVEAVTGLPVREVHFLYLPGTEAVDATVSDLDERCATVRRALLRLHTDVVQRPSSES